DLATDRLARTAQGQRWLDVHLTLGSSAPRYDAGGRTETLLAVLTRGGVRGRRRAVHVAPQHDTRGRREHRQRHAGRVGSHSGYGDLPEELGRVVRRHGQLRGGDVPTAVVRIEGGRVQPHPLCHLAADTVAACALELHAAGQGREGRAREGLGFRQPSVTRVPQIEGERNRRQDAYDQDNDEDRDGREARLAPRPSPHVPFLRQHPSLLEVIDRSGWGHILRAPTSSIGGEQASCPGSIGPGTIWTIFQITGL